jgi:hypothetical protein
VQFDTALNVVWLALGVIALATTMRAALCRYPRQKASAARPHIVGVALIVATLFPYISATDDVLRAQHFSAQHARDHAGKHNRIDNLMRLYEAMDNPLVAEARKIVLVFFFVFLICTPVIGTINRSVPLQAGRSPPSLATA